jgi:hypothetical protein
MEGGFPTPSGPERFEKHDDEPPVSPEPAVRGRDLVMFAERSAGCRSGILGKNCRGLARYGGRRERDNIIWCRRRLHISGTAAGVHQRYARSGRHWRNSRDLGDQREVDNIEHQQCRGCPRPQQRYHRHDRNVQGKRNCGKKRDRGHCNVRAGALRQQGSSRSSRLEQRQSFRR